MDPLCTACSRRRGITLVPQHRRLLVHGSRADALGCLPQHCPVERLELGAGRASLVCPAHRVDALILAETSYPRGRRARPLLMVELRFDGRSAEEADRFTERYRRQLRAGALH